MRWFLVIFMTEAACIQVPYVEVYNATESLIAADSKGASCQAEAGTICRFPYSPELTIQSQGKKWRYSYSPPGRTVEEQTRYLESRGFLERVIRLRLDNDGMIYLVLPHGPWLSTGHQPYRFPLHPQAAGGPTGPFK